MQINNYMVVFDLDDTLYKEIDFLKSAYHEISNYIELRFGHYGIIYKTMLDLYRNGEDVFQSIIQRFALPVKKEELIFMYRKHVPHISLSSATTQVLEYLIENYQLGLITDGRSETQRNKIKSLGLVKYIRDENIVISEEFHSEKPCVQNYSYFQGLYPDKNFVYVGDNVEKDFVAPNFLKWTTVCLLDNGQNIHRQSFDRPNEYLPNYKIEQIEDLLSVIRQI